MLERFREVALVDTEFTAPPGERPDPVCLVAREIRSGRRFRIRQGEFPSEPPYATGTDVLFVAYYASAELGCYRALGWPAPQYVLDLFIEFRNHTNGRGLPAGAGLFGALTYFGLDAVGVTEKKEMQQAIGSGAWRGRYTMEEVLDYCENDLDKLEQLFWVMLPAIDLPRALARGRYMAAAAAMEWHGTPIDVETLEVLRPNWDSFKDRLIEAVDVNYNVYDGRTFKYDRFVAWLAHNNIPWLLLASGRLDLSDDCFRQQARTYELVAPLRELRASLAELRLQDLAVGHDGRNRTILSAFRARTGRNQPSNTRFIFGPATWIRSLIKPPPGYGLAYIDWNQQEFGIGAALSGDEVMQAAYRSGDPYLAFAKQARAAPADATDKTHPAQRELFKQCVLAVQYGQGSEALALKIGQPPIVARDLLRAHHEAYQKFWAWSDAALDQAMLRGSLHTVFGWTIHVGEKSNPRSLRNFPCQANGAEMLRLACCLGTERGIEICCPIHDAVLVCAPLERLEADIATMQAAMAEASRVVLDGFELRSKAEAVVRWPGRYMDKRGRVMWECVTKLLAQPGLQRCAG